jgi:hypothetical protein
MTSLSRPASPTVARTVLGLTLIAIGAIAAGGALVPGFAPLTTLAVGAVLLAAFAMTRDYGFAVSGGITAGVGTMIALVSTSVVGVSAVPTILFLSLAGGFASVWLLGLLALPREGHPWPLVPAALFATFALGFGIGQPVLFEAINALFVGTLVAIGLVLVARRRQS